jgi:hypothetical protein
MFPLFRCVTLGGFFIFIFLFMIWRDWGWVYEGRFAEVAHRIRISEFVGLVFPEFCSVESFWAICTYVARSWVTLYHC